MASFHAILHAMAGWLAQFNIWMILLALLVCSAGSYTVAVLLARGLALPPRRRALWLAPLVISFAADVWATHFIAMLAFSPGPQLFYMLGRTVLSIGVAMAGAAPALAFILWRPRARATVPLAGLGLAGAIGAMHFTGMSALRLCGTACFPLWAGAAGLGLGAVFAILMLRLLLPASGPPRVTAATWALIAAICGLHFTALLGDRVAAGNVPLPAAGSGIFAGGSPMLATLVASVSGFIILAALIAALAERKISLMNQSQAEALEYVANHDELTGLANRRQLRARMASLLAAPGQGFALYYLDLDRFKPFSALFGHEAGDRLLLKAAARLAGLAGREDLLARLGGDEFVLLQPRPAGLPPEMERAEALVQSMAAPITLPEGNVRTGLSIGLVFAEPGSGQDPEALLAQAHIAQAAAKALGGGQFCLYRPEMSEELAQRRQLENDLAEALARGEMLLHFQPLCGASGTPHGFEALLRWQHRERGLISPAIFIPLAERLGHIRALGQFVLEEACRTAMGWPAHLRVAVNISALQLGDEDFFGAIKTILARTGLAPRRLELEITESTLIEDASRTGALLRAMHDYGLELAIDDFGTGYSNLSHLRDFHAGRLKIDRSFISALGRHEDAASIVRAIAGLGHALGMIVLAEGVETEAEWRAVRALGCDEVQGYYLARPMPAAEILPWLTRAGPAVQAALA